MTCNQSLILFSIHRKKQTPFNGLLSMTTWVSQHQKRQTNLDFNEARDNRVAVASAGPYANHLYLTADR